MDMATGTLSAAFVKSVAEGRAEPGKYFDSGRLILRVRPSGVGTWIFGYQQADRRRDMGLGAPPEVTLAMARELAAQHRRTAVHAHDAAILAQVDDILAT